MDDAPGPRISILPGDFRVARGLCVLSTLLGSCVSVCLYDPVAKVCGMNHFLLPVQRAPDLTVLGLTQEGRYGIDAMELLLNGMFKAGAQKPRLRAKVFGGASLLTSPDQLPSQAIGESNIRFVREFLSLEAIPIESEDLGGFRGRVIHFHTDTFAVWRRYIRNHALEETIRAEETAAWKHQIGLRGTEGEVTLFS